MPQIQEMWNKLNANERLVSYGAIVVIVAWLIGAASGGGINLGFLFALAVLVIYYLKYSPNQTITWPMPIQTLILIGSAIAALFAILALLTILSWFGILGFLGGFFLGALLAVIANAIGSVMMLMGSWREYQAMPKTPAAPPPAPPSAPFAPPPAPPSAPIAPPPAPPSAPTAPPPAPPSA